MAEFRDPAVSGTDALIARPGFNDCIQYCIKYGIKHIVVESGDRFARNLIVQETGLEWLEEIGMTLISAENETQFTEPSAALDQKNCSAPTPDLLPTTPGSIELHGNKRGDA